MQVTQALGEIRSDELRKEINGVRMQVRRVFYPSSENILIDLNWRATVPERISMLLMCHLSGEDRVMPASTTDIRKRLKLMVLMEMMLMGTCSPTFSAGKNDL